MPTDQPAILFDVDGTLVDTNWFHTLSWWRGFLKHGEQVAMSQIHPLIGMGSAEILTELFGEPRPDLKDAHTEEFSDFIAEIRAFPKAAELLKAVHDRGAQVIMCTSSKKDHLEPMLECIGAHDAIDHIVHADQIEHSKPSPEVFVTAIEEHDLDPEKTLVVGDTRWDVEAADNAGLDSVCVLTGGTSREELEKAGAIAIYEDVADLLDHLDESPLGRLLSEFSEREA